MVDDDFGDLGAVPLRVDGEEAVHLAIEPDALDDLAPIRLQRAAEVVQAHAAHEGDEAVGHDARGVALDGVVLAVLAPAAHDVEALFELGEQERDVGGVVLEVAIHRDDDVTAGEIEASHHRGGLAEIAAEMDDLHALVAAGDLVEQLIGAVGRAVIDEDELPRLADLLHCGPHAIVELGNISGFIADRDGDGKHRGADRRKWRRAVAMEKAS